MTVPNVLSIFRLLLVPVFVYVYYSGWEYSGLKSVLVYGLAAFSDVLDGYVARKYNLESALGRVLDPLGDKLMAFAVLICITVDKIIPIAAVAAFFVKEVLMGIGALVLYRKISKTPRSNVLGKISTVLFFLVCVILIIGKDYLSPPVPTVLISVALVVMVIAFVSYIVCYLRLINKAKGNAQPDNSGAE